MSHLQDNTGSGLFGLEKREELHGNIHIACIIDLHLLVESGEVNFGGLGEVMNSLYSSVEKNAIKVRVSAGHGLEKSFQVSIICDIVRDPASITAVLANELIDSVLPAAYGDDFGALADELLSHAEANARRGSHHQYAFIGERHFYVSECKDSGGNT